MSLKNWALLDIETTGIDPTYDDIIDIGYLCFEGDKLVKKYQSLVHTEKNISPFITHLTGICDKDVAKAPKWDKVAQELVALNDHYVIAHNAQFENSFLEMTLQNTGVQTIPGELGGMFGDSIPFLALMHPGRSSLKLESLIIDYQIAEKEIHRGFEDSLDLLKVLLASVYHSYDNPQLRRFMIDAIERISEDYWFKNFVQLSRESLKKIADQIEFDLEKATLKTETKENKKQTPDRQEKSVAVLSGENIKNIFENEKEIQEILPKYHFRHQQEEMALKIGQSFKHGIHGMVQAPTGTGKSLAYLIPSILFAKEQKEPVLLTTGTKVLQKQLEEKDLPIAMEILGENNSKLQVTKLIGTQNHLCESKFHHLKNKAGGLLEYNDFREGFSEAYFSILFYYNSLVSYDSMVTREEVPYALKRMVDKFGQWEENVALDFKSCLGRRCPFIDSCSYYVGIDRAKKSHLIIGNHALTFSWPKAIDRPQHVIFDEAHKIEESATQAFSVVTSLEKLSRFLKPSEASSSGVGALYYLLGSQEIEKDLQGLRKFVLQTTEDAKNHVDGIKIMSEKIARELPRYTSEYWNERPLLNKENSPTEQAFLNECVELTKRLDALKLRLMEYYAIFEVKELEDENELMAWSYFKDYFNHLEEFHHNLQTLLSFDEKYAHSLRYHENEGIELQSVPIDIGSFVHKELLEKSKSVVFTSATLGNMKGDKGITNIEWLTGYNYLEPDRRYKTGFFLDPVYDYKNNAKVYFCDDVPPIYTNEYVETIISQLLPALKEIKGKSLLLFSSYKRFELARELLLKELEGHLEVFYQGMGGNAVDEFKKSAQAVLLGLESFGEGIDIPGEKLQFIYIDKIPDLGMDNIYQMRKDFFDRSFGNSFVEYFMSTRARKLQQKLGRLIRTQNDSGVIIVTDPRISRWQSRTFNEFKQLLEPYQVEKCKLEKAILNLKDFFCSKELVELNDLDSGPVLQL
ncbi:MAG: DEAD/DEAH box helicase family protein [Halobacteriovoraceae bacterium]|nr:DEAD/DEAH box helicase family protein [Halobacteriovoraceae bacterium]MCB9094077.1 DEAD/DEAH box helicase family protein [Halobacteriovoraceae bacterium]